MFPDKTWIHNWRSKNPQLLSLKVSGSFTKTLTKNLQRVWRLRTNKTLQKKNRTVSLVSACGGAVPNPNQKASLVSSLFCNFSRTLFFLQKLHFVGDYAQAWLDKCCLDSEWRKKIRSRAQWIVFLVFIQYFSKTS